MKVSKIGIAILLLGLCAVSCRQDPIFFIISTETAPVKPRIEGAPTNMVVFERKYPDPDDPALTKTVPILYVASSRLHWYAKSEMGTGDSKWDLAEYKIDQPGGKIISLAVTPKRLYALCMDGHGVNAILRYIESDTTQWITVSSKSDAYPLIQSIYTDPGEERLFAGARKNIKDKAMYAILYLGDDDTFNVLKDETGVFSGAVYRAPFYYLCTQGDGIFAVNESDLAAGSSEIPALQLKDETGEIVTVFTGMIQLKDSTIIAVERNGGALFKVLEGSVERMYYGSGDKMATGRYSTGALALWENYLDPNEKLLIAGIQGGLSSTFTSSYTHGYVEFELRPEDGSLNINALRHDPGKLKSIIVDLDQDRYTATIGKQPINSLFQAPQGVDSDMTFFASTQTAGLWSYRNRVANGGWQWNAE